LALNPSAISPTRFLFLLVSEDRGLISPNVVYRDHYGIARLRRMLDVKATWTDHADLWLSLRTLFRLFQDDKLSAVLELAPLNGELFAPQTLDGCTLSNRDLLAAFWYLAYSHGKKLPVLRTSGHLSSAYYLMQE
jgi:hypothetical protein